MASPNLVKIHEVCKVTPSFSDSTFEFTLPLTFFDTLFFKLNPGERLFFYQLKDLTPHFFNSEILPKLKHSLSITLFHYLPLAGNLMWPPDAPKPANYYFPEDGVSVTVAESNADFNFLSGNGAREAVEFSRLVPQLLISDDKAEPIAIQITLFPNHGFCIGIAAHHAILDGKTSTMFIKSWAYLCKQEKGDSSLPPELTPSFDRSVIKDPAGIDMVYVNDWMALSNGSESNPNTRSLKLLPSLGENSNSVQATFELTPEDINNLRDMILSQVPDKAGGNESKQLHLSTFVVSYAYILVCIFKAARVEGNKSVRFGCTADYRTRLDPPVPINYFGNCVWGNKFVAQASDFTGQNGLSFAAEKLSDVVKDLRKGVLEGLSDKVKELIGNKERVAKRVVVNGSNRFDVYATDFGWGRPKKAEIASIKRVHSICLSESRDCGSKGVEVGVVLEKQEMEAFASLFVGGLKI